MEKEDYSQFTNREIKTLKRVTRYDLFEKRVELDFGSFFVMCFIDTATKDLMKLIDYKTGAQDKVKTYRDDFYDQLAIYAAACHQQTGKYPKEAHVELIETRGNPRKGEPLQVGDSIVKIKKSVTRARITQARHDIMRSVWEVHHHFRVFNTLKTIKI